MAGKAPETYINLPVASLAKSTSFFEALGWTKNGAFSDAGTSCIIASPAVCLMLHNHEKYRSFLPLDGSRAIVNAQTTSQTLICFPAATKEALNAFFDKVAAAGGVVDVCKPNQMGEVMLGRSFADPDGHIFELVWMDERFAAGEEPPQ